MKIIEYINKNSNYLPKYWKLGFSNHLPMAQYALHKIGASESELDLFTDFYIEKNLKWCENIIKQKSYFIIDEQNFEKNLWNKELYNDFYKYYENKLNLTNLELFIEKEFVKLIKWISVWAFHWIIRLWYWIMSKNKIEILNAFSYIASNYETLNTEKYNSWEKLDKNYLNKISQKIKNWEIEIPGKKGIIITYMKIISKQDFFKEIMPEISDDTNIEEFSYIASEIYANTKNFNALHMVTASHASRYILKYISKKEDIRDFYYYFIESFLAVYLTIWAPEIKKINYENSFDFKYILEKNNKSLNDHNIKLSFTCHDEYEFYKKPIYKYIWNLI